MSAGALRAEVVPTGGPGRVQLQEELDRVERPEEGVQAGLDGPAFQELPVGRFSLGFALPLGRSAASRHTHSAKSSRSPPHGSVASGHWWWSPRTRLSARSAMPWPDCRLAGSPAGHSLVLEEVVC